MSSHVPREHWEAVWGKRSEQETSWFEPSPARSLAFIEASGVARSEPVIDVGGGASRLVDELLARGHDDVTVLDISDAALEQARQRLGPRADSVTWLCADVTSLRLERPVALWHDRAVLHFLVEEEARERYVAALVSGLRPGGHAVLATFAPDGPERCSGLLVRRYDEDGLSALLGSEFELLRSERHAHVTPAGAEQRFVYTLFRRR